MPDMGREVLVKMGARGGMRGRKCQFFVLMWWKIH